MERLAKLEATFRQLGIDISVPGFYDSPGFMAQEQRDPEFLVRYAEFVNLRRATPEYEAFARSQTVKAAAFLHERLLKDGRPGACVDISGLLSRFLDRLGVWNYVVKGGLVLEFSAATGISPTYFWPIMAPGNPAIAGHTWVCAPPFKVIDISASAQPYRRGESAYISGYIAEENPTPVPARSVSVVDLLDSDVRNPFIRDHGRLPTMDELGDGAKWIPLLGAFQVSRPNVTMRYIGTAVGASDVGIDTMKYPTLSGLSPADAWNEFCDPK